MSTSADEVPQQCAATDVLALVLCDDNCIISCVVRTDGSAFLEATICEGDEQGCSRRPVEGHFLATLHYPCSCCSKSVKFPTYEWQVSFHPRRCKMLNPGVLSGRKRRGLTLQISDCKSHPAFFLSRCIGNSDSLKQRVTGLWLLLHIVQHLHDEPSEHHRLDADKLWGTRDGCLSRQH